MEHEPSIHNPPALKLQNLHVAGKLKIFADHMKHRPHHDNGFDRHADAQRRDNRILKIPETPLLLKIGDYQPEAAQAIGNSQSFPDFCKVWLKLFQPESEL